MANIKIDWQKLFRAVGLGVLFGTLSYIFSLHGSLSITLAFVIIYLEYFFKE